MAKAGSFLMAHRKALLACGVAVAAVVVAVLCATTLSPQSESGASGVSADMRDVNWAQPAAQVVSDDEEQEQAESAAAEAHGGSIVEDASGAQCLSGQALVEINGSLDEETLLSRLNEAGLAASSVELVSSALDDGDVLVLVDFLEDLDPSAACEALCALDFVESAEPNYVYQLAEAEGDADAQDADAQLAALTNDASEGSQWEHSSIGLSGAWSLAKCSSKVTVAVIDSGVDYDHEDLADNLLLDYAKNTYSGTTGAAAVDDANGHGSHVAGIVSAVADNSTGVAGTSYNANILPIKVTYLSDADGNVDSSGSDYGYMSSSAIIQAINYAVELKTSDSSPDALKAISVINMSLGGAGTGTYFQTAIDNAYDAGIVVVAAAGNLGSTYTSAFTCYPAACDNVVAVSNLAQDSSGTNGVSLSSSSNTGSFVDIAAPGSSIYSTIPGGSYGYKTGTSMASPVVAAVAALAFAAYPDATPDEVVAALTGTALDLGDEGQDSSYGAGEVQADAAVQAIVNSAAQQPDQTFSADAIDGVTASGQMVLLVNFADSTAGTGESGVEAGYNASYSSASCSKVRTLWEYLQWRVNCVGEGDYVFPTFRGYLREISGNAYDVESAFPQARAEGKVEYLTLDHEFSYYSGNDALLLDEIAEKFNESYAIYSSKSLDSDSDGYIDNTMIILSMNEDDSLTAHAAWSASGLSLGNGAKLGQYTVVGSRVYESGGYLMDSFSIGVAAHEYMHTIGARDLYRASAGAGATSDLPVSVWDMMATSETYSRPLAITRQDVGWETLSEVSNEGTYTLSSAGDAVVVKSPLSASEYFVIEYRQQGTNYADLDRKIGGSGIVVYRVNPAYADVGNYSGNDYVYVFRPNETGLTDAAGDVTNAQLGTSSYGAMWQTVGSTDLEKGITDGALVYSDGTNSGLQISVTAQSDSSITFTVEHADYDDAGVWEDVYDSDGALPFTGSDVQDVQLEEANGVLYALVTTTQNTYTVWSYANGAWTSLGSVGAGLYWGELVYHDGALYFAGVSYSSSSSSAASESGEPATEAAAGGETADSGTEGTSGNAEQSTSGDSADGVGTVADKTAEAVLDGAANDDADVDEAAAEESAADAAADADATVTAEAAASTASNGSTSLWRLSGDSWEEEASVSATPNTISLASVGDVLYLLCDTQLYRLSGSNLTAVGDALDIGYMTAPVLFDLNGGVGLACSDFNASTTGVYAYANGAWSQTATLASRYSNIIDVVVQDGTPYVFCTATGKEPVLVKLDASGTVAETYSAAQSLTSLLAASLSADSDTVYLSYSDSSDNYTVKTLALSASGTLAQLGGTVLSPGNSVDSAVLNDTVYCGMASGTTQVAYIRSCASTARTAVVTPSTPTATELSGSLAIIGSACPGSSVKASATVDAACSGATLQYQWFASDGTAVTAASSSNALSITSALSGKSLYCVATDSSGTYSGELRSSAIVASHSWSSWTTKAATCTKAGGKTRTCSKCNATETQTIKATGHSAGSAWKSNSSSHWKVCSKCSAKVSAASHRYGAWKTTRAATALTAGSKYRTCSVCGYKQTAVIAAAGVSVSYTTHVQDIGWQSWVSNGATAGTTGKSKRLEGLKITLKGNSGTSLSGSIQYRTHIQDIGWQGWKSNGTLSGTTGQSKRLEAVCIRLTGSVADAYDVYYRVHAQDYGWLGWAKNGDPAGTEGQSKRLEAIQIVLVKKGGSAPGSTSGAFVPYLSGSAHVQDIGWSTTFTKSSSAWLTLGTTGKSKRVEGVKISVTALKAAGISGSIKYSAHVQDIGWQSWRSDGALAGTTGQSKRLEAIKIQLTGDLAKKYDVYYRVHAQDYGWLGWAKNGAAAGTEGQSKRLEAIQIVLVPKGGAAPGSTSGAFKS